MKTDGSVDTEMTSDQPLKVKKPKMKPIKKAIKIRKAKQIEKALALQDKIANKIQSKDSRVEKKTKLNSIY